MNRNKHTLYKKAFEKFGKKGLFRRSAIKLNDLSMHLLEIINRDEPIENDEDFFNHLASVYICVQRLISMLDFGLQQKLWTKVHYQLDQLRADVDDE